MTFKNMTASKAIEADIRKRAQRLERFYGGIVACRVAVEAPHRHHRKGKPYLVRIDLTVPGGEIVVRNLPRLLKETKRRGADAPQAALRESHEPSKHAAHADLYVAIRDAFDAARRQLQDYSRRRRGMMKVHQPSQCARVAKLFPEEGFGFLETPDGREIYFHRNSVLPPGFPRLQEGSFVYFAEEQGEKGSQASTVKIAGKRRF